MVLSIAMQSRPRIHHHKIEKCQAGLVTANIAPFYQPSGSLSHPAMPRNLSVQLNTNP